MRSVLTIVGLILVAFGLIWILQGIGVLPGSFMSGQPKWALIGSVTALCGVGLAAAARRR